MALLTVGVMTGCGESAGNPQAVQPIASVDSSAHPDTAGPPVISTELLVVVANRDTVLEAGWIESLGARYGMHGVNPDPNIAGRNLWMFRLDRDIHPDSVTAQQVADSVLGDSRGFIVAAYAYEAPRPLVYYSGEPAVVWVKFRSFPQRTRVVEICEDHGLTDPWITNPASSPTAFTFLVCDEAAEGCEERARVIAEEIMLQHPGDVEETWGGVKYHATAH